MSTATPSLQQQVDQALAQGGERGALLRALAELAQQPAFAELAALWAPALYARDAAFFENFLVRHLEAPRHETVIAELLRRAEADGHDSLFQGLYRKVAREERWDEELRALAVSVLADEAVLRAVRRRLFRGIWFGMREQTALAFYRRNPGLFGPIIAQRLRHRWWGEGASERFDQLRAEASARGDEELAWAVFRAVADKGMWASEVRRLIASPLPPEQSVAALRRRHPASMWDFDLNLLTQIVRRFGAPVLPYIEQDALRWGHDKHGTLLAAVRETGDEAAYWRLFLRVGDQRRWNADLRALLRAPLGDAALLAALEPRLPTAQRTWWQLEVDVALELYRRLPAVARTLFARFVGRQPDPALWAAAEAGADDELLDLLSSRALERANQLCWQAFPTPRELQWRRPNQQARAELEQVCAPALARLGRLAASPARYARHGGAILSYLRPFELWDFPRMRRHNPLLALLADTHHDAWLASPEAMRELLERQTSLCRSSGSSASPSAARTRRGARSRTCASCGHCCWAGRTSRPSGSCCAAWSRRPGRGPRWPPPCSRCSPRPWTFGAGGGPAGDGEPGAAAPRRRGGGVMEVAVAYSQRTSCTSSLTGSASLETVIAPDPAGGGRREHKAVALIRDGSPQRAVAAIDLDGRLRFGQCSCDFFQRNIMSRGPCEHILAARLLLDRHLAGEGGATGSAEGEGH